MKDISNTELAARIEQATMTQAQMDKLLCTPLLKRAEQARKGLDDEMEKVSVLWGRWVSNAKKAGLTGALLSSGMPMRTYVNGVIAEIRFTEKERLLLATAKDDLSDTEVATKTTLQTNLRGHVQYLITKLKGEKKGEKKTGDNTGTKTPARGDVECFVEATAKFIKKVQANKEPSQHEVDTLRAAMICYDMACKGNSTWKQQYKIA